MLLFFLFLFFTKTISKESHNFELACLKKRNKKKKKKKENILAVWQLSGLVLVSSCY